MQTRFIIPVMVATAFYTLVFLGFNRSQAEAVVEPVSPPGPSAPPVRPPPRIFEADLNDPTPATDPDEPQKPRKGSDEVLRPEQEERLSPEPGDWVVPLKPFRPGPVQITDRIVPGLPGVPGGDDDGGSGWTIIPHHLLDNPPQTRSQVSPLYPAEARSAGLTGEVLVEFLVGEDGRVLDARVLRATNPVFESPTLRAVQKWRFEPGKKSGRPVRFRMVAPVLFNLDV